MQGCFPQQLPGHHISRPKKQTNKQKSYGGYGGHGSDYANVLIGYLMHGDIIMSWCEQAIFQEL